MRSPAHDRLQVSLTRALGDDIARALADPLTVEVYRNADSRVWVEQHGIGRYVVGTIGDAEAEQAVRLVASLMGDEAHDDSPILSGTLPGGERFQGLLPPVVASPVLTIRKPAPVVYALDQYVERGVLSSAWAEVLRHAVAGRANVLVAGGTGSGKTTLLNALLAEPAFSSSRVVVIEDTRELRCDADDAVFLLTKNREPAVSMTTLVKATLRLRPDRIVVGEVRGPEALDLVKAWNTGHPGGLGTIHANSATDALQRLEDLIGEAVVNVPRRALAAAVNYVAFVQRDAAHAAGRRVTELVKVVGLRPDGGYDVRRVPLDAAPPNLAEAA
jgi:type IV secretion system protein VirB11